MWVVTNKTPFEADYAWVIDKSGNKIWLVVVKATFDIKTDGNCRLADVSEPVLQVALPSGCFGKSSLKYEADLLGVKPTTDVLIQGSAIAPKGKRIKQLDVAFRVSDINKRLRVSGDRIWEEGIHGVRMSTPDSFDEMPLTYERAYGGWDRSDAEEKHHRLESRNPVGTGFAIQANSCIGLKIPNIEYPAQLISDWSDRPSPAGFNVIDCAWSPRRELAGTYDENWQLTRFPCWARDFDSRYRNSAPRDQQSKEFLVGGELVEVFNMSKNGILSFRIPKVQLAFRTRFGSEFVDYGGELCTVIVEPNKPRVVLAWQSSLMCNRRADQLEETLIVQKFGVS